MRKAKQQSSDVTGDWSTTGTFLRKPSGGWLHEERELRDGLSINYNVQYMGSVIINSSMRTLQFNTRTQVTKEAILRLAENSGNVYIGKKKKVPKQVDKVLGGLDLRWAGEASLAVNVDSLKISSEASGMVLLNHALPSISFASGGDGATADYIGYVAKDPVHGRACHVFECPRSSQYVLATIGQAFELRYKMYLNSPRSTSIQPVEVASGWNSDAWANGERQPPQNGRSRSRVVHTTADVHPGPTSNVLRSQPNSFDEGPGGIYSDIPDLPGLPPPDSTPPPIPSARYTLAERPGSGGPPTTRPHLENPYDTMEMSTTVMGAASALDRSSTVSNKAIYEDANLMEVRNSAVPLRNGLNKDRANPQPPHQEGEEYSTTFISIRQSRITDDHNHIDLTPPPMSHDYSNVDIPGENEGAEISPPTQRRQGAGEASPLTRRKGAGEGTPPARRQKGAGDNTPPMRGHPPPKPVPFQRRESPKQGVVGNGPAAANVPYHSTSAAAANHFQNRHSTENPAASQFPPNLPPPRHSPPEAPRVDYDAPFALKARPPVKKKPTLTTGTKPGTYDDPDEIIAAKKRIKPQKPSRDNIVNGNKVDDEAMYDVPEEGVYNTAEAVYDDRGQVTETPAVPFSPKFDDGIYMASNGNGAKKQAAPRIFAPPPTRPVPVDPLGPLTQQQYFHGAMSRVEAEALLMKDGEFLIRESTKKPGQYVLTGMAAGKSQHLLLMDKEGRVKSKDREFESVQHLIKHFTDSKLPLVIGSSQVFLKKPVVNAFLNS